MNQSRNSWVGAAYFWALLWVIPAGLAQAQQTAPQGKSNAQIEAGEPRADTSSTAAPPPRAKQATKVPTGAANGTTGAANGTTGAATGKVSKSADRLDLGTATVTGDREQPKVMYIVPWKQSDIGDLSGKPMNSLLDEALAPVDRDEFRREVAYYNAAKTPQNGASTPAAKQGEK